MNNISSIALLFTLCINIWFTNQVNARWLKIHGWWSIIWHGIKSFKGSDIQTSSIYNSNKFQCTGDNTEKYSSFICNQEDITYLDNIASSINSIEVNEYSRTSVNNYNNKVNEYNEELNKSCITLQEYCKPYNCNIKYEWTVYRKSTDTCICENGIKWTLERKCQKKISEWDKDYSSDIKDDKNEDKIWNIAETLWTVFLWIIRIFLILGILWWLVEVKKKYFP